MFDPDHLVLYVPVLPLLGAVVAVLFGSVSDLRRYAHLPVIVCAALSCACAIAVVARLAQDPTPIAFPRLASAGDAIHWFAIQYEKSKMVVDFSLSADPLAGVMLLVITFAVFCLKKKKIYKEVCCLVRRTKFSDATL